MQVPFKEFKVKWKRIISQSVFVSLQDYVIKKSVFQFRAPIWRSRFGAIYHRNYLKQASRIPDTNFNNVICQETETFNIVWSCCYTFPTLRNEGSNFENLIHWQCFYRVSNPTILTININTLYSNFLGLFVWNK